MRGIMKKLLTLSILFSTLFLTSIALSQDGMGKGISAIRDGDYATALRIFKSLAEQGEASAQLNLGVMYASGKGVPQDYKQAIQWFQRAAEQKEASAQHNLGVMYTNGKGVPQDYKQAFKWYRRAAEQGETDSQNNLAGMYYEGQGVLQDHVLAYMWVNLAAAQNSYYKKIVNLLEKKMSPSQLEEGQRLSRECLRKNYKGC